MKKISILIALACAMIMTGCAGGMKAGKSDREGISGTRQSQKKSIAEQSAKTKAAMSSYAAKTAPVANDTALISDSEASNATKKVTLASMPISTATQTALNGKANTSAFSSQTAFTSAWGWTPGGISAWSDVQALISGTGDYIKYDGTRGTPAGSTYTAGTGIDITSGVISSTVTGTLPSGTEGQGLQKGASAWEAVTLAPLAFTDNVSRNTTTGVVSVPVTGTATSGSAVPFTSGGAYTALGGKQDTLVSGANIKTINSTSLLGSGNIDIDGGTGGYVSLSATPYSDVACTTGQYGYYGSTAYLCTGGFWTSKWTLTPHSNVSPSGETILAAQTTSHASTYHVSLYSSDAKIIGQSFQASPEVATHITVWVATSGSLASCTMYAKVGTTSNLSSSFISSGSVSLSGLSGPGEVNIPISSVSLSGSSTYYLGVWTDCDYSGRIDLGYATGNLYEDGSLVSTTGGWPLYDDNIGHDLYFKISNKP